ncbi:MAG: hypothetical protein O3A66_01750 [Proteobacteria bacterium]|nr:hypothetical protein [Pseudomonadota bacterium]
MYKLLLTRGFDSPYIIQKWNTFHPQAENFFPVKLHSISETHKILYIKPQNKMAGVTFSYIKQELLYSLNHLHGFKNIIDIQLSKEIG